MFELWLSSGPRLSFTSAGILLVRSFVPTGRGKSMEIFVHSTSHRFCGACEAGISMFCVRAATFDDILEIQNINAVCLPENYRLNFYINHILSWPQLIFVAEDYNRKPVGYVVGSLDEELSYCHGQIASLAVLRTHRKLGCAKMLMKVAEQAMRDVHGAGSVSLHVRTTNTAAFRLYETLGYKIKVTEVAYYRSDGADAHEMIKFFGDHDTQAQVSPTMEWENTSIDTRSHGTANM